MLWSGKRKTWVFVENRCQKCQMVATARKSICMYVETNRPLITLIRTLSSFFFNHTCAPMVGKLRIAEKKDLWRIVAILYKPSQKIAVSSFSVLPFLYLSVRYLRLENSAELPELPPTGLFLPAIFEGHGLFLPHGFPGEKTEMMMMTTDVLCLPWMILCSLQT